MKISKISHRLVCFVSAALHLLFLLFQFDVIKNPLEQILGPEIYVTVEVTVDFILMLLLGGMYDKSIHYAAEVILCSLSASTSLAKLWIEELYGEVPAVLSSLSVLLIQIALLETLRQYLKKRGKTTNHIIRRFKHKIGEEGNLSSVVFNLKKFSRILHRVFCVISAVVHLAFLCYQVQWVKALLERFITEDVYVTIEVTVDFFLLLILVCMYDKKVHFLLEILICSVSGSISLVKLWIEKLHGEVSPALDNISLLLVMLALSEIMRQSYKSHGGIKRKIKADMSSRKSSRRA